MYLASVTAVFLGLAFLHNATTAVMGLSGIPTYPYQFDSPRMSTRHSCIAMDYSSSITIFKLGVV